MPSLGADMVDGTLVEWLVKPGDTVHRGDVVAVVDTSKAAIEVECFDDGIVTELLVPAGTKVPVGTVLARLSEEATATESAPVDVMVTSPLVRHLAQERGVDLRDVVASGQGGVIHRADVLAVTTEHDSAESHSERVKASPLAKRMAARAGIDLHSVQGAAPTAAIVAEDVLRAQSVPLPDVHTDTTPAPERRTVDGTADPMRSSIAALMSLSNREIPHYYLEKSVDMSVMLAWLTEHNRERPVAERVLPAAVLCAAVARAARDVPQMNGHWIDGTFHPANAVQLGMVVSLRRGGIIVPIIKDADSLTIPEVMAALRRVVERARTGKLRSSDLAPPSITVTNLGDQGVDSVLGVIYPPQVALVGTGSIHERPWAVEGLLGVRPVVTLSLAADHRASDGAIGGRFLNKMERILQSPEEL